jgi:hypothetical protein
MKELEGLPEIEIVKLVNKRKKRYCAIALNDLEEEKLDKEVFAKIRKIFLDNMNGFTRSVFTVIGIDVEGVNEE